jgi:hypothetical protein
MKPMNVAERIKHILDPKFPAIQARLFVAREDGITVYDSVQNQTTTSVSALVSGVWQASEALMGLAHSNQNPLEFRLAFDTSSQGIYLFPITVEGKRYFLGAIYQDCLNPGQLKRQVATVKDELNRSFPVERRATGPESALVRKGFLFKDITDDEMDRLFSVGGV